MFSHGDELLTRRPIRNEHWTFPPEWPVQFITYVDQDSLGYDAVVRATLGGEPTYVLVNSKLDLRIKLMWKLGQLYYRHADADLARFYIFEPVQVKDSRVLCWVYDEDLKIRTATILRESDRTQYQEVESV